MPDHPGSLRSPPLLKRRGRPPEYVILITKARTAGDALAENVLYLP